MDIALHTEIRFHLAHRLDDFVERLLADTPSDDLGELGATMELNGYALRITRDLDQGKAYLRDRYADMPDERFGILMSSRDRDLGAFGIREAGQGRFSRFQYGPWYVEGDGDYLGRSCRALRDCITEFGAQGLELDGALIAWGGDFVRESGLWTNRRAKRYQNPSRIKDPFQLRRNAYRVLLTRARDGSVVFVPPAPLWDETYEHLVRAGFRDIATVA